MPPRIPLSVGAPTGMKVIFSIVGLFLVLGGAGFSLLGYGLAFGEQQVVNTSGVDGEFHIDENGKLVPGPGETQGFAGGVEGVFGLSFMFCSLLFVALAIFLILRVVRSAAWLEGSRLFVRGAVLTKSADLATSTLSAGSTTQATGAGDGQVAVSVQSLSATDPETNKRVSIPVKRNGATILPSDQLSMLANAITNARTKTDDKDPAFVIAGRLRDFANDPFS